MPCHANTSRSFICAHAFLGWLGAGGAATDTARCPHALLPIGKHKAGKLRATGIYSSSDAKPVLFMLNTGEYIGQKRVFD